MLKLGTKIRDKETQDLWTVVDIEVKISTITDEVITVLVVKNQLNHIQNWFNQQIQFVLEDDNFELFV